MRIIFVMSSLLLFLFSCSSSKLHLLTGEILKCEVPIYLNKPSYLSNVSDSSATTAFIYRNEIVSKERSSKMTKTPTEIQEEVKIIRHKYGYTKENFSHICNSLKLMDSSNIWIETENPVVGYRKSGSIGAAQSSWSVKNQEFFIGKIILRKGGKNEK